MTQLPVEPYWKNAARWWLKNYNEEIGRYNIWLRDQGVNIVNRPVFYPWIDFESEYDALVFALRWA